MKNLPTLLAVFIVAMCNAQTNKFENGDFGMRYSVSFNGVAIQGLTLSGLVTPNIEVGCSVNVQFSKSNTSSTYSNEMEFNINNTPTYQPTQNTTSYSSQTITTSFTPFVFYHFKIKNNVDVYAGPALVLGTGTHTMYNNNEQITQSDGYYYYTFTKQKYPIGYQVGGMVSVGGQYFFYKRLALGVQASIGATYSNTTGNETSQTGYTNSGVNNPDAGQNSSTTLSGPYTNKSISLTTASSIGVTLTFFVSQKAKVKKVEKVM